MKITTGWYNDEFYVVKPLKNHCRQELIMCASSLGGGRWNISMGIFSCQTTYYSWQYSEVWETPTATNKNPSFKVITYALEALSEIEQALIEKSNGKKCLVYIDGLDEKRLRVYTKILNKYNYGYKKSTSKSNHINGLPKLYKRL